jgi:hypothetical protein
LKIIFAFLVFRHFLHSKKLCIKYDKVWVRQNFRPLYVTLSAYLKGALVENDYLDENPRILAEGIEKNVEECRRDDGAVDLQPEQALVVGVRLQPPVPLLGNGARLQVSSLTLKTILLSCFVRTDH